MKLFLGLMTIVVLIFTPLHAFGGNSYYIDCSAVVDGDGSFSNPWSNTSHFNINAFQQGDDIYFKSGTTCQCSSPLTVDWDGTSADKVIIGGYWDDNGRPNTDMSGRARPILNGNHEVPGSDSYGLIFQSSEQLDYLNVQDLRINNSGSVGIFVKFSDNTTIQRCYIYRPRSNGILLARVRNGLVENNVINESSYNNSPMAGITINGLSESASTNGTVVRGNQVFNCYEGIGLYKKVDEVIVEENVVFNGRAIHIYLDSVKDSTVRYNLIYMTPEAKKGIRSYGGIEINAEAPRGYDYTGSNSVYGNLIASCSTGITLSVEKADPTITHNAHKFYNNTIVDCSYGFRFWNTDSENWSGNEIKNNIVADYGGVMIAYYDGGSPQGVTWSNNLFYGKGAPLGNAAINAVSEDPMLNKQLGWGSLSAGNVNGKEWKLTVNSPAKGKGAPDIDYIPRIYDTTVTASGRIEIFHTIDNSASVGAWTPNDSVQLAPPQNLTILGMN